MSTPEQEYEEAIKRVSTFLIDFDNETGDTDCWKPADLHALYLEAAAKLLRLTWPSGQPMLGVLSKDQGFRALTALMPPERKIGFDLAVGEMKAAGFRRVVEQEEKR